jgi:hypothetical protein
MTGAHLALCFGLGLALAGSWGCGPSVQAVHEGNVRFEHCHRLDLDTRIAPSHRLSCWRRWNELYSYGQSRDRLEYARQRVRALEQGEVQALRLRLKPAEDSDSEPADAVGAPAPTSAHAPPPPVAKSTKAARPEADTGPPVGEVLPPFAACIDDCAATWRACRHNCADAAADASCAGCKPDYRACLERCLR